MAGLKEVVNRVLLPVQLSLGIFQIMRTTPLWAVIHCALASFLNFFHFPNTDYKKLKQFKGRVFKKVISHTTTAGTKVKKQKKHEKSKKERKSEDVTSGIVENQKDHEQSDKEKESEDVTSGRVEKQKDHEQSDKEGKSKVVTSANVEYLGKKFKLERKDGNIMLMKDGPAYYITDKMWETVTYIEKVASKTVFVKDLKEIWEEVVTGDIMEFEEVLNSVILDNRTIISLDNDYFLPVNLLVSEIRLTTTLNFVGLFLKTQKHVHWLIPALLTFASTIMGFSTTLRVWIGRRINKILCRSVELLCDRLPLAMRRWVYWWGNLKPSNDLNSKIVSGTTIALVAGGVKLDTECFADCESLAGADPHRIRVLVSGGANADLETSTDGKSLAPPVIITDKSNIRTFLPGGTKVQPDLSIDIRQFADRSEEWVHEIWPEVGPFLFEFDSVYIEWIFDNKKQICSLKAGRIASRESLIAHAIYIKCDDHGEDYSGNNDLKPLRSAFSCGKENNRSLIADDLHTLSVDVECNIEEAIKLLKFAFYMAKYRTTSLKSYDRKNKKATVRRFVESIKAYASSSYPPLYSLIMYDVVVR